MIEVKKKNVDQFLVIVNEGNSETGHNVELDDEYYQRLTGGKINKEDFIKKSFQFLLHREPKESIFSKFNLRIIKGYFPEYEKEIRKVIKC